MKRVNFDPVLEDKKARIMDQFNRENGPDLADEIPLQELEGSDTDAIEAKTQALAEASSKLAEKAYSAGADEGAPDPVDANASAQADTSDDVVDAEFEEVKEDDKK